MPVSAHVPNTIRPSSIRDARVLVSAQTKAIRPDDLFSFDPGAADASGGSFASMHTGKAISLESDDLPLQSSMFHLVGPRSSRQDNLFPLLPTSDRSGGRGNESEERVEVNRMRVHGTVVSRGEPPTHEEMWRRVMARVKRDEAMMRSRRVWGANPPRARAHRKALS